VLGTVLMSSSWLMFAAPAAQAEAGPAPSAGARGQVASDVTVKAGLLFNFAKFAVWPTLPAATPIALCAVDTEAIASVLDDTVRGVTITGHPIEVRRPANSASWRGCHVLFLTDTTSRPAADGLQVIRTQPVLTVSDAKGFAQAGGIIELYIQDNRMRFTINLDALDRAGLRLSSRLLDLAKTIRDARE